MTDPSLSLDLSVASSLYIAYIRTYQLADVGWVMWLIVVVVVIAKERKRRSLASEQIDRRQWIVGDPCFLVARDQYSSFLNFSLNFDNSKVPYLVDLKR